MKIKKKKILVCGATGFLGRNICEYFSQRKEFEVFGAYFKLQPFNNRKINMIKTDLTSKKDVGRAVKGMDFIIQTAAVTSGAKDILNKPYIHVTDNAIMNSLLLRSAFENNIGHFIFPSSSTVYRSSPKPLKETDMDANQEPYKSYFGSANTKIYLEKMCAFFSRFGKTKYTVMRLSNIYGPYDKFDLEKSHVFAATITKVMQAKDSGKIIVWGKGDEERDLLYISDLVNFVSIVIDKQNDKFKLYNVGYGTSIAVTNLVKKIISHSGKNIAIEYDSSKPSINTKICLDITKAKKMLSWSPRVSLDEGIKKTLQWYRHNIGEYGLC